MDTRTMGQRAMDYIARHMSAERADDEAIKAGTGLAISTLSGLRNGARAQKKTLRKLAAYANVDVETLTAPSPVTSPVLPATDSRDNTTTRPHEQKEQEALVDRLTSLHPLLQLSATIVNSTPELAGALFNVLADSWNDMRRRGLHGHRASDGSE